MVCSAVDSVTGTLDKVLHELNVTRTSFLVAAGLGSMWIEKGPPFCLNWLPNRAAAAMSSIAQAFCDSIWLLAIVHNELWYEKRFIQIRHLIF